MTAFEIHVKIIQLINSFHKNTWLFQISKRIDSRVENLTFHVNDRIPLKKFLNPTKT